MKIDEKKKAIELRGLGWSYKKIAKEINVSKGTLSVWLKDVRLTKSQKETLKENCRKNSHFGAEGSKQRWENLKSNVYDQYDPLIKDPKFMLGLGVYWGEGNKSNSFGMSNADPETIKVFMYWAKNYFDVSSFRACVHHYNEDKDKEVRLWWSQIISLPLSCFNRSLFTVSKSSLLKRKTLENGTMHITAKGNSWIALVKYQKSIDVLTKTFI